MNIDLAAIQADIENAIRQMHAAHPKARLRRIQIKDYTAQLQRVIDDKTFSGARIVILREIAGPRVCPFHGNRRYLMCDRLDVSINMQTGHVEIHARRVSEPGWAHGEPPELQVLSHPSPWRTAQCTP